MGALMAAIIPGAESMLDSAGARDLIERLGGVGALQETLVAALVSVARDRRSRASRSRS